jgi:molybdopterin molybdotransferase
MPDPHPGLLPVQDYVERILATISPLPAFPQPLMEALGRARPPDGVAPL